MSGLLLRGAGLPRIVSIFGMACTALVVAIATARAATSNAPVVALAASNGEHVLFKAQPHALSRSGDDGRHWQPVSLPKAVDKAAIASMAIAARTDAVLYVAGPGLGVWRSGDGGGTWVAKDAGLPSKEVKAITTHADQPDTVYAYVATKGIFHSEDAGDHWRLMDAGPREAIVRFVHSNMTGSMQTGWLFATTAKGVSRSMDCFCGWRDTGALKTPVNAVAFDPSDPKRVYALTTTGFSETVDGGEHWSQLASPVAATALAVGASGVVYIVDSGETVYRSSDHGHSWLRVDE